MNIIPINNSGVVKYPEFKSCYRAYHNSTIKNLGIFDQEYIKTSTNIFRDDLDWKGFIKYLLFHFAGKDKINLYSMACSDGSEAYTLAIALMEKFPYAQYEKIFPIIANDIDKEIIDSAKSGRINIEDCEFFYVNKMGIDLNNYFINRDKPLIIKDNMEPEHIVGLFSYEPIPDLKQAVEFKRSDILSELGNIKDNGNSVVLCRNVIPYLSNDYTDKIVKTASEVLKDGSLFITGDYDSIRNMDEHLLKNGFYRPLLENRNLFQKGNPKELTNRLLSGYLI